jgi:hypothetical protein
VQGIERIVHGSQLYAIIVRSVVKTDKKYNFLTDPESSLQLGVSSYAGGEVIPAHAHHVNERRTQSGQEFILIGEGKLRVTLYDESRAPLSSHDLGVGDMILLVSGGHGFEVLEPCRIVEVKQGPYQGKEADKVVFGS